MPAGAWSAAREIRMQVKRTGGVMTRYALALVCACFALAGEARASDVAVHWKAGAFDDIKEQIVFAIENRGLVVNYTARVGAMLERTGGDIGAARSIYTNAEVIEFCSATVSRAMMEADPHNIVQCPHTIAVYVLARERERVYVSYRRFATQVGTDATRRAMQQVEKLVADIVREALK